MSVRGRVLELDRTIDHPDGGVLMVENSPVKVTIRGRSAILLGPTTFDPRPGMEIRADE